MGVGKTSVCRIIKRKLDNAVFLDGDWLWDSDPFRVTKETKTMVMDNICHVLNNFLRCSEYKNIIFCWVMHEQDIIDQILARIDTKKCKILKISLICDKEILKDRLQIDINNGIRSGDIITRSLEHLTFYNKLNTYKIDTAGKDPDKVSDEILKISSIVNEILNKC